MPIKAKPPKTATVSNMPVMFNTEQSAKQMNRIISDIPKRYKRGMELFLLNLAFVVWKKLQSIAPEVNGIKYAEQLEIALVKTRFVSSAVVIFHPGETRKIFESETVDDLNTVIFIESKYGHGDILVLMEYNPWPADMIPDGVGKKNGVRLIAKAVSPWEAQDRRELIFRNKGMIQEQLRTAGYPIEIKRRTAEEAKSKGTEVIDDLSYTIMRMELGLQGKKESHWIPALKEMDSKIEQMKSSFINYLADGRESHFELPMSLGDLSLSDLDAINEFQEKISKASGLGD